MMNKIAMNEKTLKKQQQFRVRVCEVFSHMWSPPSLRHRRKKKLVIRPWRGAGTDSNNSDV